MAQPYLIMHGRSALKASAPTLSLRHVSRRSPYWLKMKNSASEAARREAEEEWGPVSRRKGETTARMNAAGTYPCTLPLPPGGFRSTTEDMLAFHRERGIQSRRGRGRNDEGQFFVTFCFGDPRTPTLSAIGSAASG